CCALKNRAVANGPACGTVIGCQVAPASWVTSRPGAFPPCSMVRKPVLPKNCGAEMKHAPGVRAFAGSGSAWGAQWAPLSWVTRSAPAREKQALVSQPSVGVANPIPVLSQAVGSPLGLAPA